MIRETVRGSTMCHSKNRLKKILYFLLTLQSFADESKWGGGRRSENGQKSVTYYSNDPFNLF
jgi:hypothetical protein